MRKDSALPLLLLALLAGPAAHGGDLPAGFAHPPLAARPRTWWHWMNGRVTAEGITADLEAMQRVGLAGAQEFSVVQAMKGPDGRAVQGDVAFMSPEWRRLIQHATRESQRLGLEFSVLNCEGWGEAGGKWITPAQSMQKVVWSEVQAEGGRRVALDLPRPVDAPAYYEDIALLAFPTPPGDEAVERPQLTASALTGPETESVTYDEAGPPRHTAEWEQPLLTMPMPMPGSPQWVQIDFSRPHTFTSLFLAMDDMRDIADPVRWDHSSFLDAAADAALKKVPGPHYFELQVADTAGRFRPVGRISTHGTSSFPRLTGRRFRIWMPVPPPLQKALPFRPGLIMEITRLSFGGPRLDRPETRAGQYMESAIKEFSPLAPAPAGAIATAGIVNLTGRAAWEAPAGHWTLLRIGHASTGVNIAAAAVGGLEADKLSGEAVQHHLADGAMAAVIGDAGPLAGTTLKNIVCDSWERGYENWTPRMAEEFQRRRGYDLTPWLPAITGRVVVSEEASERFLWDFRRTIADLVADGYYATLQAYAHAHGMGVYAEATGHGLPTIADQLLCKGRTDVPMGEFWESRGDVDDCKEAASAAHIYGQNLAGAESFTAQPQFASWTRAPGMLKAEGDLRFCMGINRMCLHRFVHQPWLDRSPGMAMGQWGSNFDRTNTWWEEAGPWIEYLSRCQFLLQQGHFAADFCYFYGEDAPMDFRFEHLRGAVPRGYDFDACNAEILRRLSVRDGRLVLPSGMSYRVLVLPDNRRMTLDTLRVIQELVRSGATVLGRRPERSPSLTGYPGCDAEVQTIAAQVWGDCDGEAVKEHRYGAGKVMAGCSWAEAAAIAPDFATANVSLRFIHRRTDDGDFYFVSNQAGQASVDTCTFRAAGAAPELWHADSGRCERAAVFAPAKGGTQVRLALDPMGSVFVFIPAAGRSTAGLPREEIDTPALPPIPVAGPWEIRFPAGRGAPPRATFSTLRSWTEAAEDGIRYFSGTATYRKDIEVAPELLAGGRNLCLDLGAVKEICRVTLNGRDLGILWKPPYRVDITAASRPGQNRLEVQVTNLWPNRLIGDQRLPAAQRIAWASYQPFHADSPLLPSGLLGPVSLVALNPAPGVTNEAKIVRLATTLRPAPDSNIRMELWLPRAGWNHRLLAIGVGGGAGRIPQPPLAASVAAGFAAVCCDLGTSPKAEAMVGHPDRWEDFGSRATHVMTVAAKTMVLAYYGEPAAKAYFVGGSTGGQQALVEAQRFPDDFDGILAGCPANNRTHLHLRILWDWQALHATPDSALTPEQIARVHAAIIRANAGRDGGAPSDDFLTDPRRCRFDWDTLRGELTPAQITALKRIYAGAVNPRTGERIVTPPPLGGEAYLALSAPTSALPNYFPYVFLWGIGPRFDPAAFDFDRDVDTLDRRLAPIMNANSPDLDAFRRHGGKLLMYTGTADTSVPFPETLNYYERVVRQQGGLARTQEFCRYFLVPGMKHAFGGDGLGDFGQMLATGGGTGDVEHDIVAALIAWVEHGRAPDRIIATGYRDGDPAKGVRLQRPIFPYPLFPDYVAGDPALPGSFRPVAHERGQVPAPADRYLN